MTDGYLPGLPWHASAWRSLQPLRARGVHAVLLHGAAGIGKKSLAIDLARAALCESPRADGHGCGVCTGCVLAAAGNHPDLRIVVPDTMASWRGAAAEGEDDNDALVIDEAEAEVPAEGSGKAKRVSREIRIEQVRALADFMATSTHRGGNRVVVLAPVELLNGPSANALLKMLEEPPAGSLFVLVTDALDDVLPTIRSRCVLVRVPAPRPEEALDWLRSRSVEDPASALAGAGGSPLLALAQVEGGEIDADTRDALMALLRRGPQLTAAEIAARVPKAVPVGAGLALFQRWGWDLLAFLTVRSPAAVRYHPREAALLGRVAAHASAGSVLSWLARLTGLRRTQDHPLNARLVIESALLDYLVCFRAQQQTEDNLRQRH